MDKKKKKASVSIISNYDGQLSPRATLDASLEDSGDWEELVMVYKRKGGTVGSTPPALCR